MDLPINKNEPKIMHIDLNSCFATIEQQAYPHLRGKPIVVAAYDSPNGCVIAPSIEAKRLGIKVGMRVRDAKLIYRNVIVRTPDPPKYRAVHMQFKNIFREYSPSVTPKSIDEAVIDFEGTPVLRNRNLVEIGTEIKQRLRDEIGEWISCNVGIATNRFLAKTAASLHKPDGLDIINSQNLEKVYSCLSLIDLCGINTRFEARLNAKGIFTPLDFFHAPMQKLQKEVFQSIAGYYWYLRLRGWEIDAIDFQRKSFGQSYALKHFSDDPKELSKLLMKLSEKMGRRLRNSGHYATGVHISCLYFDNTFWHIGRTFPKVLYSTSDLFLKAQLLLNRQPQKKKVTHLAVSCFNLSDANKTQLNIFDLGENKRRSVSDSMDRINDKYGEYTITPALMMGMQDKIIDRVAFGGVKDLEDIYYYMN